MLKDKCLSNPGKLLVDDIKFSTEITFLQKQLDETAEMINIIRLKDNYPANNYPDIEECLKKLKIEGISLSFDDFINIRKILENGKSILYFFSKDNKNEFPNLKNITGPLTFPAYVLDRINSIFTKNGEIKDNASVNLKQIRSNLQQQISLVSSRLNSILNTIKNEGWVSKELSATYVNGRLVLPIESTHKRKIKGLIHDESATGKTAYIEPQEIVELNNNIRELELEESREIQKILNELTDEIRKYREEILSIFQVIVYLDFVRAKAIFSHEINAIAPKLVESPGLELSNARHPLLFLALAKEKKEVVPLSFSLTSDDRIMVISGPNAGGKSVCLKTTGLLCYMIQCGIPVPVGGTSVFGIFKKIFIDIGDQQSVENDLSTYSSHLNDMKVFLRNADENSLILIDEFGSGTDPVIGGIIAEAILEELTKKRVFGVITTHYSNLKIFAANNPGIFNAAMLIDHNTMAPSFILQTGIPGSSYAIEIAQRIGIPQTIIEKTKELAGNSQTNIDKFLRRVLRDKKYWEEKRKKIKIQEKNLETLIEKNIREIENIKLKRKAILDEAKIESQKLLSEVNKRIENTIKAIKESNADKEITKQARKELNEFIESLNLEEFNSHHEIEKKQELLKSKLEKRKQNEAKEKPEIIKIDANKINIGSKVKIKDKELFGEIIDFNEKTAVVAFGNMYTSVPLDSLEKISQEDFKELKKTSGLAKTIYSQKILDFNPFIDIRGNTVEEAIKKVTNFVDEAAMLDFKEIKILHGKGNGILRQHIRDYLKTFPYVEACYDEDIRFGGSGITIVKLK